MSRRDDTVPMRHMLDYAREAVAIAREKTRADFERDRLLQLALARLIEMVGEAAGRVSDEGQARHPKIPSYVLIFRARHRIRSGPAFRAVPQHPS